MKFTMEINMDNSAFECPYGELSRILMELSKKINTPGVRWESIRDINGNVVGQCDVKM